MDLARSNAERDHDKPRRPLWVTIAGALLAIFVVVVVGRGFDAFSPGPAASRAIARKSGGRTRKPQPIFVVPEGQPAAPPAATIRSRPTNNRSGSQGSVSRPRS